MSVLIVVIQSQRALFIDCFDFSADRRCYRYSTMLLLRRNY